MIRNQWWQQKKKSQQDPLARLQELIDGHHPVLVLVHFLENEKDFILLCFILKGLNNLFLGV